MEIFIVPKSSTLTRFFNLSFFFPLVFTSMMYIGSTTTYTSGVFDEQGFHEQYDNGIYKYRPLGKESFLRITRLIDDHILPSFKPGLLSNDALKISSTFYAAYFYNNVLYLILTSFILCFIFGVHKSKNFHQVDLPVLSLIMLMAITQYVVVPYDTLSYFFLSLAIFITIQNTQNLITAVLLLGIIVLATLTRETSLLIGSFYSAYHIKRLLRNPLSGFNIHQLTLVLLAIGFIATYLVLRLYFGYDHAFLQDFQFTELINIPSILGCLFLIAFLSNFFMTNNVTHSMVAFLLTSLPYTFMILLVAMPYEVRLWVPLLIPLVVLKTRSNNDKEQILDA